MGPRLGYVRIQSARRYEPPSREREPPNRQQKAARLPCSARNFSDQTIAVRTTRGSSEPRLARPAKKRSKGYNPCLRFLLGVVKTNALQSPPTAHAREAVSSLAAAAAALARLCSAACNTG